MSERSFQMSNDQFEYYSDYFAFAAISGIKSARSIIDAVSAALAVNQSSYTVFEEAFQAKNNLVTNLQSSYEQVYINAQSLGPMAGSFEQLAKHVKNFTGGTLDEYLTDQGIQVEQIYANIAGLTGDSISSSNIK